MWPCQVIDFTVSLILQSLLNSHLILSVGIYLEIVAGLSLRDFMSTIPTVPLDYPIPQQPK